MRRIFLSLALIIATGLLQGLTTPFIVTVSYTFTPLHTFFMSSTGSDSNNGLTPATAWLTPNHAVSCGDVIIVATGSYTNANFNPQGTVSNCPSTTGGIDGAGGIYFAIVLCGGALDSCNITGSGASGFIVDVTSNNWAFEGFSVTSTNLASTGMSAFVADGGASGTTIIHHVAFINNKAYHAQSGFAAIDNALNHNVPGNGVDYWAVVGNIAQNAADAPICSAAIVNVGATNFDSNAGTHFVFYNNYAIHSRNPDCTSSDGEGIMWDTLDAHGFVGTTMTANNIIYDSSWVGLQIFGQSFNSSAVTYEVFNNTLFANMQCTAFTVGDSGEINVQLSANFPWVIHVYNNLAMTNRAKVGCTGATGNAYAFLAGDDGGIFGNTTICVGAGSDSADSHSCSGSSALKNVFKGQAGVCGGTCDAGNNAIYYNGMTVGSDTYTDPAYNNTTDLLANQVAVPNCAGFTNVTQCMGWDASTQTLTTPSVISDLTPTCAQCSGKGYQKPGKCVTSGPYNDFYPTWLKGIVYLHASGFVNGATITEMSDLVTKPCGM